MGASSKSNQVDLRKNVLAVCSGGGHWVQMKRILPAFNECDLSIATVDLSCIYKVDAQLKLVVELPDFNRKNVLLMILFVPRVINILRDINPTHVVSTGAAPGIITLVVARVMGCRTLWVDSIANTKRLSLSGRIACFVANQVFTQWEHLHGQHGAKYAGRVI